MVLPEQALRQQRDCLAPTPKAKAQSRSGARRQGLPPHSLQKRDVELIAADEYDPSSHAFHSR
jgi:hypothetical protein